MAIISKTVTINAAFLQEIKEDDRRLRGQLVELHNLCSDWPRRPAPVAQLAEMLVELRNQLAIHFSLEEAYGYFDEPVSADPHLCRQADLLRRQHEELFEALRGIAQCASRAADDQSSIEESTRIVSAYLRFHEQLGAHESAENELIQDAFNEDIGVGD